MFKKKFKKRKLARHFLYFLRSTNPDKIEVEGLGTGFIMKAFYGEDFIGIRLYSGTQGMVTTSKEFTMQEHEFSASHYWFYYEKETVDTVKKAFTPPHSTDAKYRDFFKEKLNENT